MKAKREKSTSTRGHYVTNAVLLPAVIKAKELKKVTDELIRMIWMIAERYSRKSNFVGYSFREDMVSAAVANMCNNALKFNPEKSQNPFSYYTTGIHNSFLQFMNDEKKHRNITNALLVEAGANPSHSYSDQHSSNSAEETTPKTSDEIDIHDVDPHDNPDDFKTSEKDEIKPARSRHPKWRAREPGPVIKYKPGEYEYDLVTKKLIIIKKEEPSAQELENLKKKAKKSTFDKRTALIRNGKTIKLPLKKKTSKAKHK